jgi:hypothetical protein
MQPIQSSADLALSEVPSNMVLNLFDRPSTFMGIIVFTWSVVVMCTGFVTNFAGLVALRILLGIFEYAVHDTLRTKHG